MTTLSSTWLTIDLFLCLVCLVVLRSKWFKTATLPYPPGPSAKSWLAGNLSDVSTQPLWLKCIEWANEFGGLIHFRTFNKHFVVLNNLEIAHELLEKRSNSYSSRPHSAMKELMGWDWTTSSMAYGDRWRAQRRLLQQYFKPEASRRYQEVQTRKIHDLMLHLLTTPDDFFDHIRHSSGAVIMSVLYDHDVIAKDDHYIKIAETAIANFIIGAAPGAFLVNTFPLLRVIPEWFPGAYFKRFAKDTSVLAQKMLNEPVEQVRKRMNTGNIRPCIAAELLENCQSQPELENVMAMCGTAYAGGADTTVAVIESFFYAMVNHQDIQKKAQEEICKVVGNDRLPAFKDRSSLPYIEALFRELLRWRPIFPMGLPRETTENDLIQGYYLPKGTSLFPNVWAMTRDISKYQDPEAFNPSRFLDEDLNLNEDDVEYTFGFGRRICPGRHLASATVWLSIASVLTLFDIRHKKDASGKDIPADVGFDGKILQHPLPFECSIIPRSDTARRLIHDAINQQD